MESTISGQLLQAILGSEVSVSESHSHNVLDPTVTSCANYTTYRRLTGPIVNALKQISSFDYDEFHSHYFEVQETITKEKEANLERVFEDIFMKLTSSQQRAILGVKTKRYHRGLMIFQWLSTTLISLPRSSGMLLD